MKLLLLEDDAETARVVAQGLGTRGYDVAHAETCPRALELVAGKRFDAAVLDLMVPGGSGYDVLRALRAVDRGTLVLILTARDAVAERIDGLERGADDYLVKPFAFAELLARLRALERRPAQRLEELRLGKLEIDPVRRRVLISGQFVDLTKLEFELLWCLAERHGEVLTRRHLLELVWRYRFDPGTKVVEVHIARLRRKLEGAGGADLLRTVRGVGYVVDP